MDSSTAYCVATVVLDWDPPREEVTPLGSFEEVVTHLRTTYNWFADLMADKQAAQDTPDEVPVGGFGVELRNRWGGVVEVGVGREVWFLMRLVPKPSKWYSDAPMLDGHLAFWLNGWHHTELDREALVSRTACLEALRQWLETGEFPKSSQAEFDGRT